MRESWKRDSFYFNHKKNMTVINRQSITVPGITSVTSLLYVRVGDAYTDHTIEVSGEFLKYQMIFIIREEMRKVKEDVTRIQEMLDGNENEMKELAYTILDKYSPYISRCLRASSHDRYYMEKIILDWQNENLNKLA